MALVGIRFYLLRLRARAVLGLAIAILIGADQLSRASARLYWRGTLSHLQVRAALRLARHIRRFGMVLVVALQRA